MKRAPYPTDLPSDSLEIIEPDRPMEGEDVDFYPLSEQVTDLICGLILLGFVGLCAYAAAPFVIYYFPRLLALIGVSL